MGSENAKVKFDEIVEGVNIGKFENEEEIEVVDPEGNGQKMVVRNNISPSLGKYQFKKYSPRFLAKWRTIVNAMENAPHGINSFGRKDLAYAIWKTRNIKLNEDELKYVDRLINGKPAQVKKCKMKKVRVKQSTCWKCGNEYSDGWSKFCDHCGKKRKTEIKLVKCRAKRGKYNKSKTKETQQLAM